MFRPDNPDQRYTAQVSVCGQISQDDFDALQADLKALATKHKGVSVKIEHSLNES